MLVDTVLRFTLRSSSSSCNYHLASLFMAIVSRYNHFQSLSSLRMNRSPGLLMVAVSTLRIPLPETTPR